MKKSPACKRAFPGAFDDRQSTHTRTHTQPRSIRNLHHLFEIASLYFIEHKLLDLFLEFSFRL